MKIYLNSCCAKKLLKSTLLLIFSVVCHSVNAERVVSTQPVFQLHLLKKSWDEYMSGLDNTPERALATLEEINLSSESLFTFTENEIESYNWPDQSILLTADAISFLLKGIKSNKKELMQNAKESVKFGICITNGTFLVLFKGQKLYAGVIDNEISTRGYWVPTLFIQIAAIYDTQPPKIQLRLVIRPLKTIRAMLTGYQALDKPLKNQIEIPEVHDFFQQLGKLTHDASPHRVEPWLPQIQPLLKKSDAGEFFVFP